MVGVRRGRGPDTRLQRSWPVPDMPLKNKRLTPGRYQGTGGRGNWEADRQTDTLTGRKKKDSERGWSFSMEELPVLESDPPRSSTYLP